jgi:stage II sporulation protein B
LSIALLFSKMIAKQISRKKVKKLTKPIHNKTTKVLLFFFAHMIGLNKLSRKEEAVLERNQSNQTITIKINGQEKAFVEEKQQPIIDEIYQSNSEVAVSTEVQEESFDWILPDSNINEKKTESIFVVKNSPPRRKWYTNRWTSSKESLFKPLFISAVFAVLLGTSFGLIVLKTITAKEVPAASVDQPVDTKSAQSTELSNVPDLKIFAIQGGVFSTKEAAVLHQELLKTKHISSSVYSLNGKFYVLLGVADSLEKAKQLAGVYKENGTDAYWKELVFTSGETKNISKKEKDILIASQKLYESFALYFANVLSGSGGESDELLKQSGELASSISDTGNEKLQKMVSTLFKCTELLNTKQVTAENAKSAQQYLLDYVSFYQNYAN